MMEIRRTKKKKNKEMHYEWVRKEERLKFQRNIHQMNWKIRDGKQKKINKVERKKKRRKENGEGDRE